MRERNYLLGLKLFLIGICITSCTTKTVVNSHETYPDGQIKVKKKEVTKRKFRGDDEIVRTKINYKEYHENGNRKRIEKSRDINRILMVRGLRKERKMMIKTFDERGKIVYKYTKGKNDETVHKYVDGRLVYLQVMENGRVKRTVDVTKEKVVKRYEKDSKMRNQ